MGGKASTPCIHQPNTGVPSQNAQHQQRHPGNRTSDTTNDELAQPSNNERVQHDRQPARNKRLEDELAKLREELRQQQQYNESLTLRLSKVAADKLLKSNPNIADLSDANRPTKLGEVYSETYDNEYTESFGALCEAGYSEIEAVDTLRDTLLNTFEFCSEKSAGLLTKTEDAIKMLFLETKDSKEKVDKFPGNTRPNATTLMPGQGLDTFLEREKTIVDDLKFALKWKPKQLGGQSKTHLGVYKDTRDNNETGMKIFEDQMKKLRKDIAVSLVPSVQKAYLKTRWDTDCIDELKPFIEKCIFITWMMNVQSPPMAFLKHPTKGAERFDEGLYRFYTKKGDTIDYVVWPTLMLTGEGPLVLKGVAQGK